MTTLREIINAYRDGTDADRAEFMNLIYGTPIYRTPIGPPTVTAPALVCSECAGLRYVQVGMGLKVCPACHHLATPRVL